VIRDLDDDISSESSSHSLARDHVRARVSGTQHVCGDVTLDVGRLEHASRRREGRRRRCRRLRLRAFSLSVWRARTRAPRAIKRLLRPSVFHALCTSTRNTPRGKSHRSRVRSGRGHASIVPAAVSCVATAAAKCARSSSSRVSSRCGDGNDTGSDPEGCRRSPWPLALAESESTCFNPVAALGFSPPTETARSIGRGSGSWEKWVDLPQRCWKVSVSASRYVTAARLIGQSRLSGKWLGISLRGCIHASHRADFSTLRRTRDVGTIRDRVSFVA